MAAMDTRRRWYIATGLVIVALILATDPFTVLNRVFRRPVPVPPENAVSNAGRVVRETGLPATEYLVGAFEDARVVFLGEFPQVADHAAFVAHAVPALGEAGIRTIALEHLRSADQATIDALVGVNVDDVDASDPQPEDFDATTAEELLFRRDVTWGFREYRDILQAVWAFNRDHQDAPMRVHGLGIARDPETSPEEHEVRLEAHMAEVLAEMVTERAPQSRGALIYVSARRAIPRIPDLAFRQAASAAGFTTTAPRRLAVWAHAELDAPSATILLHAPWPEESARYGLNYPATGLLDHAVFASTGARPELPWGFDVKDTSLGSVSIDPLGLRPDTDTAELRELTDGYIVVAPLSDLRAATPIPNFVRPEWEADAVDRYPGDIPDSASAEDINRYIARTSENLSRILESFRDVE